MKYSVALKGMAGKIRERMPEDSIGGRAVLRICATLDQLGEGLAQLETLAGHPHPGRTEAAQLKEVAKAYAKLLEKAEQANETVNSAHREAQIDLQRVIDEKAGLNEDKYAPEIRASLRAMPLAERTALLTQAVKDGNTSILAAATGGPGLLVGLPNTTVESLRTAHTAHCAGAEMQLQELLIETLAQGVAAAGLIKRARQEFLDPVKVAQFAAQEAAADSAAEKFEAAVA